MSQKEDLDKSRLHGSLDAGSERGAFVVGNGVAYIHAHA